VEEWRAPLKAGWNMIGSVYGDALPLEALVDDPPGTLQKGNLFRWDSTTKTYYIASHIISGESYWAACSADCSLTMAAPE